MYCFFFCILHLGVESQEVATPSSLLGPEYFNYHAYNAGEYLKSLNIPAPTKQGPVLFPNDGPPSPKPPLVVTTRPLLEAIADSNLDLPLDNATSSNRISLIPYLERYRNFKGLYEAEVGINDIDRNGYDQANNPDYIQDQTNEIQDATGSANHNKQNYAFAYAVKDKETGDDFSHSQKSSGAATNGEYRVRLPDGRMQIVSYTADKNGYKADVRYDKEKPNIIDNRNDYSDVNPNLSNDYNVINNNKYNNNGYNDYGNNNYDIDGNANNEYDVNNNYDTGGKGNGLNVDENYFHNSPANYDYSDNNYIINNRNVKYDTDTKVNNDYDVNNANARILRYKGPGIDYNGYDSREYFNEDYSSEYSGNYPPYQSKFSKLLINDRLDFSNFRNEQKSTVRPSYIEFKDYHGELKDLYDSQQKYNNPVYFTSSSIPTFSNYETTTEKVVIIGTKPSYYNLKQNVPVHSSPTMATSPRNYLVSTIASLKNMIVQPVFSGRFINKLNKFLTSN